MSSSPRHAPNMNGNARMNGNGNHVFAPQHEPKPANGSAEQQQPMYSIPINQRPEGYGSWWATIMFPILFNLGIMSLYCTQVLFCPLWLIPVHGRKLFQQVVDWTKDGFGRLLITITVLFAPTSLVITTDSPDLMTGLVERDRNGDVTRINLPDRLVLMSNHQAYLDWMYLWMLACYCGHAEGLTILLKASLKNIPIVGWGMQSFRFIFLHRSWAADRDNLANSLHRLAQTAKAAGSRHPLWLLIFPEGTITSDEERVKSARYAAREGVDDFTAVLHPRSTGLLFCLRTLVHDIPDLKLLDITIGYPGVPYGKYPQEWYGLGTVFWKSVPPPIVRIHLRLHDLASPQCEIPSLESPGIASPEEARTFELWLRDLWAAKERQVEHFAALSAKALKSGREEVSVNDGVYEVVPIRQIGLRDWCAAFGEPGMSWLVGLASHVLGMC